MLTIIACPVWGQGMPTRDNFRHTKVVLCSHPLLMHHNAPDLGIKLTCGRLVIMSSVQALGTVTIMDAARGPPVSEAGTVTPTESAQPGMQLHSSRANVDLGHCMSICRIMMQSWQPQVWP